MTAVEQPRVTSEQLRINEDNRGCLVDQYGRDAEQCARSVSLARFSASSARAAIAHVSTGNIILGRLGGGRQVQRLETIAVLFDRVAERDQAFADELREGDEIRSTGAREECRS